MTLIVAFMIQFRAFLLLLLELPFPFHSIPFHDTNSNPYIPGRMKLNQRKDTYTRWTRNSFQMKPKLKTILKNKNILWSSLTNSFLFQTRLTINPLASFFQPPRSHHVHRVFVPRDSFGLGGKCSKNAASLHTEYKEHLKHLTRDVFAYSFQRWQPMLFPPVHLLPSIWLRLRHSRRLVRLQEITTTMIQAICRRNVPLHSWPFRLALARPTKTALTRLILALLASTQAIPLSAAPWKHSVMSTPAVFHVPMLAGKWSNVNLMLVDVTSRALLLPRRLLRRGVPWILLSKRHPLENQEVPEFPLPTGWCKSGSCPSRMVFLFETRVSPWSTSTGVLEYWNRIVAREEWRVLLHS